MKKSLILITTLLSLSAFSPPECKYKVNTFDPATNTVVKETEKQLITTRNTAKKDVLVAVGIRNGNDIVFNLGLTVLSDRSLDAVITTTNKVDITLENDSVVTMYPKSKVKPVLFASKAGVNFQYGFDIFYQVNPQHLHQLTTYNVKKIAVYYTNNEQLYVSTSEIKDKYTSAIKNVMSCVM